MCFAFLFLASLAFCIALFNMFLFVYFSVLFYFAFHKYLKKMKKKKTVCLCSLVLVYLGWPLKQSFLNFVSLVV